MSRDRSRDRCGEDGNINTRDSEVILDLASLINIHVAFDSAFVIHNDRDGNPELLYQNTS